MTVALFFGTFDPLHIGHVAIAGHVLNTCTVDALWFVLSPHNPHKAPDSISDFALRASALKATLAYYADPRLQLCEVENELPPPSYTITTLECLEQQYPDTRFAIVMGGDSLLALPTWYRSADIIARYPLWVYPRGDVQTIPSSLAGQGDIHILDAPLLHISSTYIREGRRKGFNMRFFEAARV